jgi:release factor glutamine methyltransferase
MQRLDRVEVLGHTLDVPPGVHHPVADGSSTFLYRTVGPMVAPGHRILDLGTGCGLGALVAASRGADVVAVDIDPAAIAAAKANVEAAGLSELVEFRVGEATALAADEAFDQVWWNAPQRSVDPTEPLRPGQAAGRQFSNIDAILRILPQWLGERGRLVISVDLDTGLGEFVRSHLPDGYRSVQLASSLPLGSRFIALSLGFDLEEARRRRHAARDLQRTPEQKAAVSRRRWAKSAVGDVGDETTTEAGA